MVHRVSKILFLLFVNVALFFTLDRAVYFLILQKSNSYYSYDSYNSNERGYFRNSYIDSEGTEVFYIDRGSENDRAYENNPLPSGSFQVLAIGDSFTYGQGVYLEDTYIKRLERRLKTRNEREVFGINLGKSGIDVSIVHHILQSKISSYRPKLVVYGYVLNDMLIEHSKTGLTQLNTFQRDDGATLPINDLINKRVTLVNKLKNTQEKHAFTWSYLVRHYQYLREQEELTKNTIKHYQDIHSKDKNPIGIKKTINHIVQMKRLSQESGSNFVVMIMPIFFNTDGDYPFSEAHTQISSELETQNIEYIDLLDDFRVHKADAMWVHEIDQHPNELAHKIITDRLESWIIENLKI